MLLEISSSSGINEKLATKFFLRWKTGNFSLNQQQLYLMALLDSDFRVT